MATRDLQHRKNPHNETTFLLRAPFNYYQQRRPDSTDGRQNYDIIQLLDEVDFFQQRLLTFGDSGGDPEGGRGPRKVLIGKWGGGPQDTGKANSLDNSVHTFTES